MQDFRQLAVWKRAHLLVLHIYEASEAMPEAERFGLLLNLRRTAISVASKIAEGSGRGSDAKFAIELRRSRAAITELEYLLLLSRDLGHLPETQFQSLTEEIVEVRKMISGLISRLTTAP
ncbi:four helix bundle protein [Granulicella tundricola]|uniref:S23 ribosomal protein n=1 Tax=Granulicella tundricola (strain ATCC BAA-1859 / DSM 23138 / MP5ACTX9) TaxID=1198114 RepID=E8X373_GRATM|nr:four helix bundle protein [Granulicella tundricola]ADW69297.1 S23 ribosomal protein [Granulicella tundricola MP5ACTX9]